MRPAFVRSAVAIALFVAAGAAGYWVSSRLGRDALRTEVELQLSRVFEGRAHVGSASIRFTPRPVLDLRDARVDYPAPGLGALRARAASGGIDPLALLTGRFRLDWLIIEGVSLRAERGSEGLWSPPFLEPRPADGEAARSPRSRAGTLDAWTAPLHWIEACSRLLLSRPWAARHLRLLDAELLFEDAQAGGAGATVAFALRDLDIALEHDWLIGRPSLRATGAIVANDGERAPLEIRGERTRRGALQLRVSTSDLSLATFRPYAQAIDPEGELGGHLTGVFDYASPEPGHGRLELDLLVEQSRGGLKIGAGRLRLDTERFAVGGTIETTPRTFAIEQLQLRGPQLGLELDAHSERPLGPGARARARIALLEIGVGTAERVAATLPPADAQTARQLLARVRSGRIRHLALAGTADIREWQELVSGDLPELPPGFNVSARVEDFTLSAHEDASADDAASDDLLSEVSADFEWQGRRLMLRDVRANWNGSPLPRLDISAVGARQLLMAEARDQRLRPGAVELPGLPALWERLRGDDGGGGRPPVLELEIDELHHPAFRWPLEDALALLHPMVGGGIELSIPHARWAGVPIRARGVLQEAPETTLSLTVWVGDDAGAAAVDSPPASPAPPADAQAEVPTPLAVPPSLPGPGLPDDEFGSARDEWARGRVRIGTLRGPFATKRLSSEWAFAGAVLRIPSLEAALEPRGRGLARGAIDLGEVDRVSLNLAFEVEGADLDTVSRGVGMAPELVFGTLDAKGALGATLATGQPFHAGLDGVVEIDARDGQIQRGIPLLSAVAHAAEGFNPFSARDALHFETLRGIIEFDDGRISSPELTVDGPVRIFASGAVDLRPETHSVDALVGVFVLRHADLLLGDVPIVNWLVPGSDRGLLGAYFQVSGPLAEPEVRTQAARSLMQGVPLPDVVRAPFEALRAIGELLSEQTGSPNAPPRDARRARLRRRSGSRGETQPREATP